MSLKHKGLSPGLGPLAGALESPAPKVPSTYVTKVIRPSEERLFEPELQLSNAADENLFRAHTSRLDFTQRMGARFTRSANSRGHSGLAHREVGMQCRTVNGCHDSIEANIGCLEQAIVLAYALLLAGGLEGWALSGICCSCRDSYGH